MMKSFACSIFCGVILCMTPVVFAQESEVTVDAALPVESTTFTDTTSDTPVVSIDTNVVGTPTLNDVTYTIGREGSGIVGFRVLNTNQEIRDFTYTLDLSMVTDTGEHILVKRTPSDSILTVHQEEGVYIETAYMFPTTLWGNHVLTVVLTTPEGVVLDTEEVTARHLSRNEHSDFILSPETCTVDIEGAEGVALGSSTAVSVVPQGAVLISVCTVQYATGGNVKITPRIETYATYQNNVPVEIDNTFSENAVTFTTLESKEVVTKIAVPIALGTYTTFLSYGSDGNAIGYTYTVVEGEVSDVTERASDTIVSKGTTPPVWLNSIALLLAVVFLLRARRNRRRGKNIDTTKYTVPKVFIIVGLFGMFFVGGERVEAVTFTYVCTIPCPQATALFYDAGLERTTFNPGETITGWASISGDDYVKDTDPVLRFNSGADAITNLYSNQQLTGGVFLSGLNLGTAPMTPGTYNWTLALGSSGYKYCGGGPCNSMYSRTVTITVVGASCSWGGGAVGPFPYPGGSCDAIVGAQTIGSGNTAGPYQNIVAGYKGSVTYLCTNGTLSYQSVSCQPNDCQGSIPVNAIAFDTEESSSLPANTDVFWTNSSSDTGTKCQYRCSDGYTYSGGVCVATIPIVNGSCGVANNQTYNVGSSVIPIANRCSTGTYDQGQWGSDGGAWYTETTFDGNGIASNASVSMAAYYLGRVWNCDGSGGGVTRGCKLYYQPVCGGADGGNFTSAPLNGTYSEKIALCQIGTASAVTTSAGSYTWSCTNGAGPTDFCSATRLSANTAPVVSAGVDRTITLPTTNASPSGVAVSDAQDPVSNLLILWTQVGSTPVAATIAGGNTITPTFSGLTSTGVYTFRLTVTDGGGLSTIDTMTVTVNPAAPICSGCPGGTSSNVDIDANNCTIVTTGSSCSTVVTWDSVVGAVTTPRIYKDGALFASSPSNLIGMSSGPLVHGPHTFDFRDGAASVLESVTMNARCDTAAGYNWDNALGRCELTPSFSATIQVCDLGGGGCVGTGGTKIITAGAEVQVAWSSIGATSCTASAGAGFSTGGSVANTDTSITEPGAGSSDTYTVSCTNGTSALIRSVTVQTSAAGSAPVVTVQACNVGGGGCVAAGNTKTIIAGSDVEITWTVSGSPTSCSVSNGAASGFSISGLVGGTDSTITEPSVGNSTVFGVTCSNANGVSLPQNVTVSTNAAIQPNLTVARNDALTGGPSFNNPVGIRFAGTVYNSDAQTGAGQDIWADVEIDWNNANGCATPSIDSVGTAGGPWTQVGSASPGINWSQAVYLDVLASNLQNGTHCYRVVVDRGLLVTESNNNDNATAWRQITISGLPSGTQPNLTVARNDALTGGPSFNNPVGIRFAGTVYNSDAQTGAGQDIWADVEIDWNNANGCATPSIDSVGTAGGPWTQVGSASPGINWSQAVYLDVLASNLQNGTHCYRVVVDRGLLVNESNNNDNATAWRQITISGLPNPGCTGTTQSNCTLGSVSNGVSSGSCESGYTGSCSYTCQGNDTWTLNSNTCTPTAPLCSGTAAPASQTVTANATGGTVWGSGPFKTDSNLATIARFLGAPQGGSASLIITDLGCVPSYIGGTANGVTTSPYASPWKGMSVSLVIPPVIDTFEVCTIAATPLCTDGSTPIDVPINTPLTVTWNVTPGSAVCSAMPSSPADFNVNSNSGSDSVVASGASQTYQIGCTDGGGLPSLSSVIEVTTTGGAEAPILGVINGASDPVRVVNIGDSVRLTWDTGGTTLETACTLSGGGLTNATLSNGTGDSYTGTSAAITISGRTLFRMTCGGLLTTFTLEAIPRQWES